MENKQPTKQTVKNRINKGLHNLPVYNDFIPLDEIFQIIKDNDCLAVDESGESWSGILCGESGNCIIRVTGLKTDMFLNISWYKMPSSRYETLAYIS